MNTGSAAIELQERITTLGPWFHNLNLEGIHTAPEHFLGDFPTVKWKRFAHALPADLTGWSVLDIGCNAGFYSIEMKRRGASRVVGIDHAEHYLRQAKFAAGVLGLEIEFLPLSVYQVADLQEQFDLVLFLGVLYHLRHPLLALDLLRQSVCKEYLVFQTMQRGSRTRPTIAADYAFWETSVFDHPGYPKMHFIERSYSDDPTNWWVPNRACSEAMLRGAGFLITDQPEDEVYICRVDRQAALHSLPEGFASK